MFPDDRGSLKDSILVSCGELSQPSGSSHAITFAVKLAKNSGPDKSSCLIRSWGQDVVQVKDRLEVVQQRKEAPVPEH